MSEPASSSTATANAPDYLPWLVAIALRGGDAEGYKNAMPDRAFPKKILEVSPAAGNGGGGELGFGFHPTPLGRCLLAQSGDRICYLAFAPAGRDRERVQDLSRRWPAACLAEDSETTGRTVRRIFPEAGAKAAPLKLLVRGTPFQIDVWQALLKIPPGDLRSYAEIALAVRRPKAVRAVGSAIGANPVAWLIPCHRVVRSDGGLGGYRWGLATKRACQAYEKDRTVGPSKKFFFPE